MGAAYFIVLDNTNPGFDPFVNGKAIAREAKSLSRIAKSLGLRPLEDYINWGEDDANWLRKLFRLGKKTPIPEERWFEADEGLKWATAVRDHLQENPSAVGDSKFLLEELDEYIQVFSRAQPIGAKWHLLVDF